MDKSKSPKPSDIVHSIYDFCEEEKDIANMSLAEVSQELSRYNIEANDAVSRVKNSIAKIKAKAALKEAADERMKQLKEIASSVAEYFKNLNSQEIKTSLSALLGIQPELAFRNFKACPEQDLISMANDLKVLEEVNLPSYNFKKDEINPKAAAYHLTQMFFISKPKEIDLEAIAMQRGVLVIDGDLDGCEARLIRRGGRGVIRVSKYLTPGQRRFAIAHELGHWEMHRGTSQWQLCTGENIASYNSSLHELQASLFAAEFLLPTKLLRPLCEEVDPSMDAIRQISNDFETGLIASALRFIELNENPCMVVLSDGRFVKWWRRNPQCANFWFQSRQEIGGEALAVKCGSNKVSKQMVPYKAWFKHIESDDRDSILEESIKLGSFNDVLTLLWLV